jgi:protein-tyrosine phosphatase
MKKVYKLLSFTGSTSDISDPWYTGDFDKTYEDIYSGCEALLEYIAISNNLCFV